MIDIVLPAVCWVLCGVLAFLVGSRYPDAFGFDFDDQDFVMFIIGGVFTTFFVFIFICSRHLNTSAIIELNKKTIIKGWG